MRAIVYHRYGGPEVLELQELERPVPGDGEVLIKVRAASVNPLDRHSMRGEPLAVRIMMGVPVPKVTRLGVDVAGVVEAIGRNVTQLKAGDEVFGSNENAGSFAEYLCAPETAVIVKPRNITFEQAAAVTVGGVTALQSLRDKGQIRAGDKVLINGAAGGVGTFAVQIAKAFGAHVTGVCSTRNVEMVRSIGADHVVDYTRDDFTKSAQPYALIVDAIGNRSLRSIRRVLAPSGRYVILGGPNGRWIGPLGPILKTALSSLVHKNLFVLMAKTNRDDLIVLRELIDAGKVMPVIDRTYRLEEVGEAIAYLETGHARGKVVVTVAR